MCPFLCVCVCVCTGGYVCACGVVPHRLPVCRATRGARSSTRASTPTCRHTDRQQTLTLPQFTRREIVYILLLLVWWCPSAGRLPPIRDPRPPPPQPHCHTTTPLPSFGSPTSYGAILGVCRPLWPPPSLPHSLDSRVMQCGSPIPAAQAPLVTVSQPALPCFSCQCLRLAYFLSSLPFLVPSFSEASRIPFLCVFSATCICVCVCVCVCALCETERSNHSSCCGLRRDALATLAVEPAPPPQPPLLSHLLHSDPCPGGVQSACA